MQFFRRGKSGAWLVLTIADPSAPTATEIAAGTKLSQALTAIAGFETTLNRVNTPVMAYQTELQTDGPRTFGDASMTLMEDDGSGTDSDSVARAAAYTALAEGTTAYIVFTPKTTAATTAAKAEVWPIKIGAKNRSWSLDVETARYTVQLAITGSEHKDVAIA